MGVMTRVAEARTNAEPRAAAVRDRAPIDRVHLARYTMSNLELEIEILGLFAMQAPLTLEQLQTACTAKAWKDAAHTLKGSAWAVGAKRVGDLAAQAEALGFTAGEADRRAAIANLCQALEEATRYIEDLDARG